MAERSNYCNRFVPYVNAYFQFFLLVGLTFQFILLYLIRTKSPASLAQLKYFLYNTSCIQILEILCGYFTQHRSLPNTTTFAVLANGPCRLFGPSVCFAGYHVFLIIPFTDSWDFPVAVSQTYSEHPTYDLSYYVPFPGFANISSAQFLSATSILAIGAYGIPLISFLLTRSILKLIRAHSNMSTRTKTQARPAVRPKLLESPPSLMTDSNRYVPYFDIYYYFYFVIGVIAQCVLLLLIKRVSPPSLDSIRYFLMNTWIVQFSVIFTAFFTQSRCLPNTTSYAVLPRGPCRFFGPNACFSGYHISLAVSMGVALSIANTVLFRYLLLRFHGFHKTHYLMMIAACHIPSIFLAIVPFLDHWDFSEARSLTLKEHPSYDLSLYEPFPGFANIQSLAFVTATSVVAIGAYAIPLGSFFIIFSISSLINRNKSMSARTKMIAKLLVKGLAFQTILPFLSYTPIASFYLYSQFTGEEMLLTEHFLMLCSGFPALCDPFITSYCIIPYRQAISRYIQRKTRGGSGNTRISTISARSVNLHVF
ncbi:unnamed protein product [Caenorhabditis sp. 36 PRJEB53466]|nr:unnamed protein product [Caenorhabditis sp. 36 PRJEB53466]